MMLLNLFLFKIILNIIMADGDIFKIQNSFFLQLGELVNDPNAPFAVFIVNRDEQIDNYDPHTSKMYFPKGKIPALGNENFYIKLTQQAITIFPLNIFSSAQYITNLSYAVMNTINRYILSNKDIIPELKKFLKTNRQ